MASDKEMAMAGMKECRDTILAMPAGQIVLDNLDAKCEALISRHRDSQSGQMFLLYLSLKIAIEFGDDESITPNETR
jgi:hypothetical protein